MTVNTVYGLLLNDAEHLARRRNEFLEPPYKGEPKAPILYIKPRNCLASSGADVVVPAELDGVQLAATLALRFTRSPRTPDAVALAIDISDPHEDFYRPAIKQRCRDGFLPLGDFVPWNDALGAAAISLSINGAQAHSWTLDRLVRDIPTLIADVTEFMTLSDGDLLLVGLAGDAPVARPGARVEASAPGLPSLSIQLVKEPTA